MRSTFAVAAIIAGCLWASTGLFAQSDDWGSMAFQLQDPTGGSHIGVQLKDIDSDRANVLKLGDARGVEVLGVEEDSPAEEAGIKKGDVLLSYNGENIIGAQQLGRLVGETPRGRKIKVEYWREGKVSVTTVTTAARAKRWGYSSGGNSFDMPDMRDFTMPDVPNALLVWKNSLLGIDCESLDAQLAQYFGVKNGVLVRSVTKGSAADKAGVKAGDVVTAIGDRPVSTPKDVSSYMRSERRTTKSIALDLTRERKPLTVKIVTEPRP